MGEHFLMATSRSGLSGLACRQPHYNILLRRPSLRLAHDPWASAIICLPSSIPSVCTRASPRPVADLGERVHTAAGSGEGESNIVGVAAVQRTGGQCQ